MNNLEKRTELKGVRSFQEHRTNPFLETLTIKTKNQITSIARNPVKMINTETGEIDDTTYMHTKRAVDEGEFIKIYRSELKVFGGLSERAVKVLVYFMSALKINDDTVYFDLKDCKEQTGYSATQSVFFGLAELLDKKAIARTTKTNIYFINPSMMFNGNRLVVMREYVKKKHTIKDPMQLTAFPED